MAGLVRTWVIADPHFLHTGLVRAGRPPDFSERIYRSWKRDVKPEDRIIVLGDIAVGEDHRAHEQYIQILPGIKILVKGNHDRRTDRWYLERGWAFVCDSMMVHRLGQRVLLSHIPQPDLTYFDLNIHGHLHDGHYRRVEPEISAIVCEKHILLACEINGYRPLLLDSVIERSVRDLQRKKDDAQRH